MEGVISRLFEGHIQKSITCLNVPYKSAKRDAYMDIFLDVRNCKNLYDSFDRLTAKERMDGDNQYNAEGYGMQVRDRTLDRILIHSVESDSHTITLKTCMDNWYPILY